MAIKFINDFSEPRRQANQIITEHLDGRGEFSFSYITLLLSSTIVCTLGLITNSIAVVIGGMIIAPLMWPLLKIAFAIAKKRSKIRYQPFLILAISTLTIFLGAALVAFLSPIKQITPEILTRTEPTTLEIFIALAAGAIAALAITHPKISDSVAGVAVATSLVPPLCASGVGLAYLNTDVMYGSFLLFLTNAVAIILVTTIIFTLFLYGRDFKGVRNKHIFSIVLVLAIISLPLSIQLRSSIASASVSKLSKDVIELKLEEFAPGSELQDYQVVLLEDDTKVSIKALILLPPSSSITYEQEQEIIQQLEQSLGKNVDAQLVLQESLKPITEKEIVESSRRTELEEYFVQEIKTIDSSLQLNTISTRLNDNNNWDINASIRTTNNALIGLDDVDAIESKLSEAINAPVQVTIELIESRVIDSDQTQRAEDEKTINNVISRYIPSAEVLRLTIEDSDDSKPVVITATIVAPDSFEFNDSVKNRIKNGISSSIGRKVVFNVNIIDYNAFR